MSLQPLTEPVEADLRAVDQLIGERLHSDIALINALGDYIVASGGKRLRPMLVLMIARLCGDRSESQHLLAAIIEFIHTATLLHDDVVDQSTLRRGRQTANLLWGNEAAVLTGDFLYSRAFEMMAELNSHHVIKIMAHATNRIAEGEVMQLMASFDPDLTEARYLELVDRKTASLFSAGCELSGILASRSAPECEAITAFGRHLGIAFQIVDDCLDYGHGDNHYGKNRGDDLAEGQTTLPLIHALAQLGPADARPLRNAIENGDSNALDEVVSAIESTDAIPYTSSVAVAHSEKAVRALDAFDDTPARAALIDLAYTLVDRRS